MRLGLSSAAAPDATLDELLDACARRGLAVLELRGGDGHGVAERRDRTGGARARDRAAAAGVAIGSIRSDRPEDDLPFASLASGAGAALLVGGPHLNARVERAVELAAFGANVAVVVDGDASAQDLEGAARPGLRLAWDADAAAGGLGPATERILRLAGNRLDHVRLLGGGPEAALHEGRGVGELMARLALAGYDGSVILAPGSARYRVAWEHWLGRRGGWGCGSTSADPSLVSLAAPLHAGAGR